MFDSVCTAYHDDALSAVREINRLLGCRFVPCLTGACVREPKKKPSHDPNVAVHSVDSGTSDGFISAISVLSSLSTGWFTSLSASGLFEKGAREAHEFPL